jgi:hypothetical protein
MPIRQSATGLLLSYNQYQFTTATYGMTTYMAIDATIRITKNMMEVGHG